MVKANRFQIILASIALVVAAVLAHVLAPRELMARTSASLNLQSVVPTQFGIWKLVPDLSPVTPADPEGYVEADVNSTRIYSQEVGRTYTDGKGNIVMLMVALRSSTEFSTKGPSARDVLHGGRISESRQDGGRLSYRPERHL